MVKILTDNELILVNNSRFELKPGQVSLFDSLSYILAGESIFTLLSLSSGTRFTYKCDKLKDKRMWFLSVLTGSDNTNDYSYIGTIDNKESIHPNILTLRLTNKSKFTNEAPSYIAFSTILKYLQYSIENINILRDKLEIYHNGSCSKCGRHLTDPVSLIVGQGPICNSLAHKQYKAECKRRGIIIKDL